MSRSGENPGLRKGKRGRICFRKVISASGVEIKIKFDVRG
jgi:hypothetical protein